jgi:group I intron endonuclease
MSKGIIYCAHCVVNNKKYIGQTINTLETRKYKHKNSAKNCKKKNKFYSALRKYGIDNFIWGVVEEYDSKELDEKEKYWIEYFSTFKYGYNSTLGGEKYCNPNSWKEFIIMGPDEKIYVDKNISKFCRNYNISPAHLSQVISGKLKSHKGWKLPETILKRREYNIVVSPNNIVYSITNITHFCNEHNLSTSHLVKVLNEKRKHHKGWKKYKDFINFVP